MAVEVTMDLIKQLREKTSVGMMDCKNALIEAEGDFDKAVEILRKKGAAVAAKRADNTTNHGLIAADVVANHQIGSLVEVACETDFAANTDALKGFTTALAKHLVETKTTETGDALMQQSLTGSSFTVAQALEDVVSKISENTKVGRTACFTTDAKGIIEVYIHPGATLGVMVEMAADKDVSAHKDDIVTAARSFCMQAAVTNPLSVRPEELDQALVAKEKQLIEEQLAASGKPAAMIEKITTGKLEKYYEENCLLRQKYIKDDSLKVSDVCDQLGKKIGATITIKRFVRFAIGK